MHLCGGIHVFVETRSATLASNDTIENVDQYWGQEAVGGGPYACTLELCIWLSSRRCCVGCWDRYSDRTHSRLRSTIEELNAKIRYKTVARTYRKENVKQSVKLPISNV